MVDILTTVMFAAGNLASAAFSDRLNLCRLVFEWGYWSISLCPTVLIGSIIEEFSSALGLRISIFCVYQVVRLVSFTVHRFVFILWTLVEFLCHQPTLLR